MTNNQHGQVPEALRLAEEITNLGCSSEAVAKTIAAAADELCRQHARIAELESELAAVGAGGVQALSAAPAGWKLVPVNPTPEMWKAAKSVPDPNPPYPPHYGLVWDAMLAASPAPQPSPAPLSDDTDRLREALQRIEGASMSMYATRSDMLEHCQDIARAAIAAQGGK